LDSLVKQNPENTCSDFLRYFQRVYKWSVFVEYGNEGNSKKKVGGFFITGVQKTNVFK